MKVKLAPVLTVAAFATALLLVVALTGYGWAASIRVDSGDVRYCFLGWTVLVDPMPEPQRTMIVAIADESLTLTTEWRPCPLRPPAGSNQSGPACRDYYRKVAAWAEADPTIARLALEDLAEYIVVTQASGGVPDCAFILGPDVIDATIGDVLPGWRSNESVRKYCEYKGHSLSDP